MSRIPLRFILPALLEWAGLVLLSTRKPLENHIVEAIAILIVTSAVYLISAGWILKERQCGKRFSDKSLVWWIGAFSLLFRFTVFTVPPAFTDDVLRYRWEARLQLEGASPYEVAPSDPAYRHLRDETYGRISGPDFRAVYGPFTELAYRVAYQAIRPLAGGDAAREVFWLKLPSIVFELGVLGALFWWVGERALIYAWSPLPVFEFWVNGHNDTLLLLPLVLSLLAVEKGQWTRAFGWLGLAASAKLWPMALFPVFLGRRLRHWKESLLAAVVFLVMLAPFGLGLARNAAFTSGFLGGWRNNDSIHGGLLWLTGDQYPAKYSAAGLLAMTVLLVVWLEWPASKAALTVVVVMLLVSSNNHPWYLSWVLVLLPAHPSLGLLLWTALVPIAYRVLPAWEILGEWNGVDPLRWYIYIPVFAVLLYEAFRAGRGLLRNSPTPRAGATTGAA